MTVLEHTSTNASPGELFELAQAVAQVKPGLITTCVVGGRVGFVGAASVVFPDVAQARRWGREAGPDATLRRWFDALADGGTVTMPLETQMWGDVFGMCTDRFGVDWMVNITGV